ncbi:MAG: OmpA family protein [Bacteroidia bacterium]|nr:OmpA family protein [Bacteroidia bacterium]
MPKIFMFFLLLPYLFFAQMPGSTMQLKVGDKAPSLVLLGFDNSIQGFNFPLNNKVYLIHFWSSGYSLSKKFLPRLLNLYQRYNSLPYRNIDGFDVITVAVQSDKIAWKQDIEHYNLTGITNLIAQRGFNDAGIKNWYINLLPTTFLVNEQGIIVMINPTMLQIEQYLDEARNFPPNRKDLRGRLLMSPNLSNGIPSHNIFLLNTFEDTLQKTKTNDRGIFTFSEIKLLNDYIFRPDTNQNQIKYLKEIYIADANDVILPPVSKNASNLFDLQISGKDIQKFYASERKANAIQFVSKIKFKENSATIEPASLKELDKIKDIMTKQSELVLEVICHTDSKLDDDKSLKLSQEQANAIKNYLVSKGIPAGRITSIGMGEKEILNKCKNKIPCTESEHEENRRTEFKFYK